MTYAEGTPVLVKYPAPGMTNETPRENWRGCPARSKRSAARMSGWLGWQSRDVATTGDGAPAPTDADDADVFYPCCFRGSSEIRAAR